MIAGVCTDPNSCNHFLSSYGLYYYENLGVKYRYGHPVRPHDVSLVLSFCCWGTDYCEGQVWPGSVRLKSDWALWQMGWTYWTSLKQRNMLLLILNLYVTFKQTAANSWQNDTSGQRKYRESWWGDNLENTRENIAGHTGQGRERELRSGSA